MIVEPSSPDREVQQSLLDMSVQHNLTQIHETPTKEGNLLDLVFTTNPSLIRSSTNVPGISDHDMVVTDSYIKPYVVKKPSRKCYRFDKAKWDDITKDLSDLSTNIEQLKNKNKSIEQIWSYFRDTVMTVVNRHVPSKLARSKKSLPWLTPQLRKMLKKKSKLYKTAKKSNSWGDFKKYQKQCQKQFRKAEWDYVNNIIGEGFDSNNSKPFWNYIKSKKQDNIGVAPLKLDGNLVTDSKGKANILINQFKSVFTIEKDSNKMPDVPHGHITNLEHFIITTEGVQKLLKRVNPAKAVGPDGIPNIVLKTCADTIAPALTQIFQLSIDTGDLPNDWRNANIAPVYKKSDRHAAENYRPVSLTSVSSKLLEHIICKQLLDHLERHNILTTLNHGFRSGYSCETQLAVTLHDLVTSFDKGKQTDVIILDFSKAFDTVPHKKLLHKLQEYGISGPLHQWLTNFLTKREMRVVVDGEQSDSVYVDSGVPQGTVLGPILFLSHQRSPKQCTVAGQIIRSRLLIIQKH
jgi:hypothetical protein